MAYSMKFRLPSELALGPPDAYPRHQSKNLSIG